MELPDEVHHRILELSDTGEQRMAERRFRDALQAYQAAFSMLPAPAYQWEAATWLLAAIGDAQFLDRDFSGALDTFRESMLCPNALENPFLRMRLGQSLLEVGHPDAAREELAAAYMLGGREVFSRDDPKYFAEVEAVLLPPPGFDRLP